MIRIVLISLRFNDDFIRLFWTSTYCYYYAMPDAQGYRTRTIHLLEQWIAKTTFSLHNAMFFNSKLFSCCWAGVKCCNMSYRTIFNPPCFAYLYVVLANNEAEFVLAAAKIMWLHLSENLLSVVQEKLGFHYFSFFTH